MFAYLAKKQYLCPRISKIMLEQELSNEQIARQDYVDNKIFDLLNDLIPSDEQLDWDINAIGQVRDAVCNVLTEKQMCTEQDFYPYIKC